jgi:3-oxoadipate enol-lactonase
VSGRWVKPRRRHRLEVALLYGALLRGAVYSEPPLFSLDPGTGESLMRDLVPSLEEASATGGSRAAVDAFFSVLCPACGATSTTSPRTAIATTPISASPTCSHPSLDATPPGLATVALPALVLSGGASHLSFRPVAHRLAAALPDARLVELEGSGHVTYAERPDEFANAVRVFAAELDRRTTTAST